MKTWMVGTSPTMTEEGLLPLRAILEERDQVTPHLLDMIDEQAAGLLHRSAPAEADQLVVLGLCPLDR
ncbi:hypothetical protein BOSEA31B_10919 [Hyphomicrobiales bacterium]|nr:hypothetical protein BOSEA31B_10919 [Hyphomicrobiales bacterium]CAI0344643.1 hypothetical protein BO1005MUT1_350010 [Hyphomicrobiales bacterium]